MWFSSSWTAVTYLTTSKNLELCIFLSIFDHIEYESTEGRVVQTTPNYQRLEIWFTYIIGECIFDIIKGRSLESSALLSSRNMGLTRSFHCKRAQIIYEDGVQQTNTARHDATPTAFLSSIVGFCFTFCQDLASPRNLHIPYRPNPPSCQYLTRISSVYCMSWVSSGTFLTLARLNEEQYRCR